MFRLSLLLILSLASFNGLAQSGCYVGNSLTGARMYFVKHPTLGGNNYTSAPPNNNYIVLGTGTFNCTNNPTATFATNVGAAGASCSVYSESPQILIGTGTVRTFTVYQCPIDDYLMWLVPLVGGLGFVFFRRLAV